MRLLRKYVVYVIVFVSLVVIFFANYYFLIPPIPEVTNIAIDENNNVKVEFSIPKYKYFKDIYCNLSNGEGAPRSSDSNWIKSQNNSCEFQLGEEVYNLYLKNFKNDIISVDKVSELGKVLSLSISKSKVYLPVNSTYKLNVSYTSVGNVDDDVIWESSDPNVVIVDNIGKLTPISKGKAIVSATVENLTLATEIIITDLIVSVPKKYNYEKKLLKCNEYSKAENDLLDEILKDRVNEAGYATRAGVVEAARFLTLEFPYRIRYFSENGRMAYNASKVDGEGRYYHKGLYLHSSRYSQIKVSKEGPKTWGCNMYNRVSKRTSANGLDCSGFITWVLLNGGFDPGDIGAGVTGVPDLTDIGEKTKFNKKVVDSGKVKVGDLLSSSGPSGGHIAIIVGMDKNYYYVAESLWSGKYIGVVIMPYKKTTIFNRYYYVMLMDTYYKKDGNYTTHWYNSK